MITLNGQSEQMLANMWLKEHNEKYMLIERASYDEIIKRSNSLEKENEKIKCKLLEREALILLLLKELGNN